MKKRFSLYNLENAVEAERQEEARLETERLSWRVYTHIVPCASFSEAVSTPGRTWGWLLRDWHILLLDRGETPRLDAHEGLARQFPDAWAVFISRPDKS